MDSIFIYSSLTTPFPSQFPPQRRTPTFRKFTTKPLTKCQISSSKTPKNSCKFFPLFSSPEAPTILQCCLEGKKSVPKASGISKEEKESVVSVTKTLVYAVFCIAVSFSSFTAFKAPAVAAPAVTQVILNKLRGVKEKKEETEIVLKAKDHEYSDYTRRLLQTVSSLLKTVEEARSGKADMDNVKAALKVVKARKEELEDEIMGEMYRELKEMKKEKEELVKRGERIVDEVLRVQRESEEAKGDARARMLERIGRMDREYGELWDRVGEIDDGILRRETVAMSVGVRELCFIDRECEELVRRFCNEMKRKSVEG